MGFFSSLFGSNESSSSSSQTTVTETSNVAAESGAVVASGRSTINYLDPETVSGAFDYGKDVTFRSLDVVENTVDDYLNAGDRLYGRALEYTSDLITLEADRSARQEAQIAAAYSQQLQGGIDTQKLLFGLMGVGVVLGGIALYRS